MTRKMFVSEMLAQIGLWFPLIWVSLSYQSLLKNYFRHYVYSLILEKLEIFAQNPFQHTVPLLKIYNENKPPLAALLFDARLTCSGLYCLRTWTNLSIFGVEYCISFSNSDNSSKASSQILRTFTISVYNTLSNK